MGEQANDAVNTFHRDIPLDGYKNEQQEQNRLKLEVASLKTPARIETLAKGELGMALPTEQQVVIVK